jgi:hypothetical protein
LPRYNETLIAKPGLGIEAIMRALNFVDVIMITISLLESTDAFKNIQAYNVENVVLNGMKTTLFLKATSVPTDTSRRHPVKTGTHTYASWRSPDQQLDSYDDDDDDDDESKSDDFDSSSESDVNYDDESNIEIPSTILVWLRKLYDSMFFYGLDPAPAAQKNNKRKMMRDAESYDRKKNSSPFFTPSEQRVQRYMTSMRNKETSALEGNKNRSKEPVRSPSKSRVNKRPTEGDYRYQSQTQTPPNAAVKEPERRGMLAPQAAIMDLEDVILDLSLELELVEAEIVTSSQMDLNYQTLRNRKEIILDKIEDLKVDLVTRKSTM